MAGREERFGMSLNDPPKIVLTKSGKVVRYYTETAGGSSGYVLPTPEAIAGRYESWDLRGHATYVKADDLSWAQKRSAEITYDTLTGYNYIRCAQNHASAILFRDGAGITICRGTQLLRLAYNELSPNYEVSKGGIVWEKFEAA